MEIVKVITLGLEADDLEKLDKIPGSTYTGILRELIHGYEAKQIVIDDLKSKLRISQDNYYNLKSLIRQRNELDQIINSLPGIKISERIKKEPSD